MDFILQFYITYYDKEGDQVFDRTLIAKHYVMSIPFIFDLVASFPLELIITNGTRFGGIKLTKLYKLNKLPEWINRLNSSQSCKHFLKAMIVLLSLSIFIITMGCFWLDLVYSTKCKWYPLIV